MIRPSRGDIWLVNLSPVKGREQAGVRPGLIVSVNQFNDGPADLVVLVPVSSKLKGIPFHVEITPPEGGLEIRSYIKCEDIRSVSKERLAKRLGMISNNTLKSVEDRIRILLNL